jgi:hypothetical protein
MAYQHLTSFHTYGTRAMFNFIATNTSYITELKTKSPNILIHGPAVRAGRRPRPGVPNRDRHKSPRQLPQFPIPNSQLPITNSNYQLPTTNYQPTTLSCPKKSRQLIHIITITTFSFFASFFLFTIHIKNVDIPSDH